MLQFLMVLNISSTYPVGISIYSRHVLLEINGQEYILLSCQSLRNSFSERYGSARKREREKIRDKRQEVNQINCLVGYSTLGGTVKEIQYQKKKKRNCPHKRDESD